MPTQYCTTLLLNLEGWVVNIQYELLETLKPVKMKTKQA